MTDHLPGEGHSHRVHPGAVLHHPGAGLHGHGDRAGPSPVRVPMPGRQQGPQRLRWQRLDGVRRLQVRVLEKPAGRGGLVTLSPSTLPPTHTPRRACPQCRIHSSYIIPCRFWVSKGPEKEQRIRNFKAWTRCNWWGECVRVVGGWGGQVVVRKMEGGENITPPGRRGWKRQLEQLARDSLEG